MSAASNGGNDSRPIYHRWRCEAVRSALNLLVVGLRKYEVWICCVQWLPPMPCCCTDASYYILSVSPRHSRPPRLALVCYTALYPRRLLTAYGDGTAEPGFSFRRAQHCTCAVYSPVITWKASVNENGRIITSERSLISIRDE